MSNKTKIEDVSRQQIAEFLPDAIKKAMDSYQHFSDTGVPTQDAKDFGAHHTACKVAIAHIELLLKLARWADLPDAKDIDRSQQVVLAAVMGEAQRELLTYQVQTLDWEDEDE